MYAAEYEQIELDLCARCRGVWFDADELSLLLGHTADPRPATAPPAEKGRGCPRCRKSMDKANIGPDRSVVIDVCPDGCGLWFDEGEARDLSRDLAAAGWQVDPAVQRFLADMFPESPDQANGG
jgi:Zn-finger nucleic acid-binding protein